MVIATTVNDLIKECKSRKNCNVEGNKCYYFEECKIFLHIFKMFPHELASYKFINDIKQGEFIWK